MSNRSGRASMDFVPSFRPKVRPVGRFSCRASPHTHQTNTTTFFHQVLKHFIIFISIAINNTYIQVITTSIFYFYRAVIGQHWNGPGHRAARAARPYINKCTMKICFIINSMVHSTININVF